MTKLEELAIELHDYLWLNMGIPKDEWPLQIGGDDKEVTELTRILNELQNEIKTRGLNTIIYNRP